MTTFDSFNLDPVVLDNLKGLGFEKPTPIQAEAMTPLMEGRDIIGQARTGSGKTAAFGLPMIALANGKSKRPKGLILCPTRELALQVTAALQSFAKGLPLRLITVYGGASYQPQLQALRRGVEIVVGTPGRVNDLIDRGSLNLSEVKMFVLDEADEMLRMGFMEAVEAVLAALPGNRQIALFSATMPKAIQKVAGQFLNDPHLVQVETRALSVDHIEQRWIKTPARKKPMSLIRLLQAEERGATLIFCRTRAGCAEAADGLAKNGFVVDAIHGDLNQAARERVLKRFRSKQLDLLVATDVAARGIDVSHITHVINFDYPDGPETYTHRIGRTGRAGAKGVAITFVTPSQKKNLHHLKKATGAVISEMELPSARQVAEAQRANFIAMLKSRSAEDELVEAHEWVTDLTKSEDWSAEKLAAVALQMLAEKVGLGGALGDEEEEQEIDRSRNLSREQKQQLNEVELYIGVGRRAGIQVGDLLGALTNECGVVGTDIGRIQMHNFHTFVGMRQETALQVLEQGDRLTIRGRHARITLSKQSDQSGDPKRGRGHRGRNDGGGRGGGGRGGGGGGGGRSSNFKRGKGYSTPKRHKR